MGKSDKYKLKDMVGQMLKEYPETRNCDKKLCWQVWETYYGIGHSVSYGEYLTLPAQDHIKRIRAVFQNVDNRYLPTDEQVAIGRGWAVDEWRKLLGYGQQLLLPEIQHTDKIL